MSQLLSSSFDCQCGIRHTVPIRAMVYHQDAIERMPDVLADCASSRSTAIMADKRTWELCGRPSLNVFETAGWKCKIVIVPDGAVSGPSCDDATVVWLKSAISALPERPGLLIAVGSGTVNDLTKWSAFELGIPYAVVATAASMNGYSAANVAPMVKGVKVLIRAAAPVAVFARPDIIENAPFEMIASGFGDAIAKYMSRADWMMNHSLFGEHYCPLCSNIVDTLEPLYLADPNEVRQRRPAAIKGLFEALFWSGVAMTMVGSSAPASGGEHLLSHTLDMMARRDGQKHDLHGRQVGVGTIFSAALYERLLQMDTIHPVKRQADIDSVFWKSGPLVSAVREQWDAKGDNLGKMGNILADSKAWMPLNSHLQSAVRPPAQVKGWLAGAGAACTAADIGCTRQRLRDALLHMHQIRKRCTVVDLAWVAGIMPDIVDDIIDQWLQ